MKILYHHRIASKDGQYVHVAEIIKALRELGHEVIVVAPKVAENSEFGSDGGWVDVLKNKLPKAFYELLEFSYSFYAFLKLSYAILKYKPDAIYERCNLFLPSGIWAKKLFNLKLQLEVNSPLYDERNKYGGIALTRLARWSENYVWKNADRVLPVTQVMANYVRGIGVPEERIYVIPNGVDTSVFTPQDSENRAERFKNKLVVGFVGFCREWHQLDKVMTVLAAEKREDLFFLVVGDGPVISELKKLASTLGFDNQFESTGLVKREDMPYWLDQMDIALQPAVTPWASPLKMIEYFAKGLAIVAPDMDNIKELIEDNKNGVLFDRQNLDDMMVKLHGLLDNNERRIELAQQSEKTISQRNLTWKNNAESIVKGY
ncbi:glycosyltransferase family 4 protein [Alteromonadaceae bacterium BrNp21-10]|nr:glycosyltransferase family 4 protein [Alteromonadaceae bacterium BrNp21-10]